MSLKGGQKLILAFATLIIAVSLITTIATQSLAVTDYKKVSNESHNLDDCVVLTAGGGWEINESDPDCNITVTHYPTGWKTSDCPITNVIVNNGTGSALTPSTDYNLYASNGIIQMLDTTATENLTGNNTYIYYSYCGDDYLNLSWGRTLLNLVAGFFAIGILLVSIGLFYSIAKENGII